LQEGKREQANRWVLYSYTVGQHGYVQMMICINDRDNIEKSFNRLAKLGRDEVRVDFGLH
jgi:hypothetical protein